ncbi:MAG: gamma carbonic anhydrase family protein [Candidatus Bilamarchaeum sp.]|jgi:carbonic anhydrase/acetyltransferase-like protein (isoleucine patch superfamily)
MIYEFNGKKPKIAKNCFIAKSADILGYVEIDSGSSIWFNTTIRSDLGVIIRVGKNVSIQDNSVLHTDNKYPLEIADDVVIGHRAIVHSAKVGSNTIVGMGAILLSGSEVGKNCIIGAGCVVTEETKIPDNSIVLGIPGKVVKQTTPEHIERIKKNVHAYVELNKKYLDAKL